jgi:iron complex outermembrane receptor protein
MKRPIKLIGLWLVFTLIGGTAGAQQTGQQLPKVPDLASMTIEDLLNINVTTPSKRVENLSHAPAAIFMITGDEIRRGGFSSVPDVLRMVPGLYVVQQSAHVWIVSARGFSSAENNKMLVLIDGRLAYSPTYGGVNWDVQDPPMEDISRIEVIRGAGGTLWGANAVNGVINIITKHTARTVGEMVSVSAGVNEGESARIRFGGKFGDDFTYRIYGTANSWLPTVLPGGAENYDAWSISQGGARFDWTVSRTNKVKFDGEGYSGRIRDVLQIVAPASAVVTPMDSSGVVKGGHLLGRWDHEFNDRSFASLLGYCDWTDRAELVYIESRNICDVEFQNNYSSTSQRQLLIWGGSAMTTGEVWGDTFTVSLLPPKRRDTTYSGFLQYDIVVAPDKFRFLVGSKFEHNDYTGFEFQPQIRAVWTPGKQSTVWASFSRAVRTPTRLETDMLYRIAQINPAPPPLTFFAYSGNPNVKSEAVKATEVGYRYQWNETFSVDATIYYNQYDRLIGTGSPAAGIVNSSPFYVDVPEYFANVGGGQTHGLELQIKYIPVRRWILSTGITELRGVSAAGTLYPAAASDPRHMVNVQSKIDLTPHVHLDAAYYYNDAISNSLLGATPPLNRVDVGVSTTPIRGFTFSVWGRNLQQNRHKEAIPQFFSGGEIRRSIAFKLIWESRTDHTKGTP